MSLWMMALMAMATPVAADRTTAEPIVFPTTPGLRHADDFTVRVRRPGGVWRDLFEQEVTVDLDAPQKASMVQFAMAGPVEVEVRRNNGDVRRVEIRPLRAGITPRRDGATVRFMLDKPAKLSIEFDGDRLHNLHLFALQPPPPPVAAPGTRLVSFAAGVHVPPDQPGSVFAFPSDTTVYLAPGAVLRGKVVLDRVHNVRIIGPGIIDQPERGFEVTYSSDIVIDGPTVINPRHYTVFCGQSDHLTIRDLKTFSAAPWSDGLDFMSCSDVGISDVFLRTSDDSIAIYGHRWNFSGDARNFDVRDAILWADVAHPINIGLHGGGEAMPETIENLAFRRIDILEHDEDDPEYQGAMAISDGDSNLVRHVSFDDVAVEHVQEGKLLNVRVVYNARYSLSQGRGIEDVSFSNIRVSATGLSPSIIAGLSAAHAVRGVSIRGLTIGGKRIDTLAAGDIALGPFVSEVSVAR